MGYSNTALALFASICSAAAQGTTAFTYQGQLRDGGVNANGTYTMFFKLFDAPSGGNQIGATITITATLANGLFTVNLDFGVSAFDGGARWLDITVRGGTDTQTLSPRVQVLPVPYAIFASGANSAAFANSASTANLAFNLVNPYNNAVTFSNSQNCFFGSRVSATNLDIQGWTVAHGRTDMTGLGFIHNGTFRLGIADKDQVDSQQSQLGVHIVGGSWIEGGLRVDKNISALSGTVYALSFSIVSDRNVKEQLTPVDSGDILERVVSLPITCWNFRTDPATRHIGPMAQDFYAAFKVGPDDKHISTVDEGGVALAAIQGLNQKLTEKDAEIQRLEKRLADLEALVKLTAQR